LGTPQGHAQSGRSICAIPAFPTAIAFERKDGSRISKVTSPHYPRGRDRENNCQVLMLAFVRAPLRWFEALSLPQPAKLVRQEARTLSSVRAQSQELRDTKPRNRVALRRNEAGSSQTSITLQVSPTGSILEPIPLQRSQSQMASRQSRAAILPNCFGTVEKGIQLTHAKARVWGFRPIRPAGAIV